MVELVEDLAVVYVELVTIVSFSLLLAIFLNVD
jgi:hypothetical protein